MPRAVITGVTGQDGLYLGELLAAKGYEVYRLVRGQSNPKIATVEEIIPSIELLEGDLRDLSSLISALEIAQPDEVYNLGAISFVGLSWKQAELTGEITGMGVLRMLEEGRDCEDIVTQLSAVGKALDRAGFAIIATGMRQCLVQADGKETLHVEKLEKLFLSIT